jgi:probable HAF family extracellular repeat protein
VSEGVTLRSAGADRGAHGGIHGQLLTYPTLDVPSFYNSAVASGINDSGQIVGNYQDSNGKFHGFLYSNGIWTTLDDPSAGAEGTLAQGINDFGQIVGYYFDSSGVEHGFIYSSGTWITLDDPAAVNGTAAYGINDWGQIVGSYIGATQVEYPFPPGPPVEPGFLYSNGTWTNLYGPYGVPSPTSRFFGRFCGRTDRRPRPRH